jgi:hypothetical protein
MWVFSVYGFYSLACAYKEGQKFLFPMELDPEKIMIRARTYVHLQNLKHRFPEQLRGTKIVKNVATDYRWRIVTTKAVAQGVVGELVMEMTWSNFKSEVLHKEGRTPYESALHSVWWTMLGLQREENAYFFLRRTRWVGCSTSRL